MIKPFKTTISFSAGPNAILGLLTPSKSTFGTMRTPPVKDERSYILAICDWCGAREYIDDPCSDYPPGLGDLNAYLLRQRALSEGLNWVTNGSLEKPREFCSRRCRSE